jgi:hypothetical protein
MMENMLISGRVTVGIKRMGQLDEMPFHLTCKLKHRDDDDPEGKAASLVSSWQEQIQNPSWRPFTTIKVDGEDKVNIQYFSPFLHFHSLNFVIKNYWLQVSNHLGFWITAGGCR